jgi:hypothetical protein
MGEAMGRPSDQECVREGVECVREGGVHGYV